MPTVEDYVARIEGTCGEEKDTIVIFKYGKKDEAIAWLKRAVELEPDNKDYAEKLKKLSTN